MIKYEDQCVGCPPEMGCLGSSCPNRNVKVITCDVCGAYGEYEFDGKQYCESCLIEVLIDDGVIEKL